MGGSEGARRDGPAIDEVAIRAVISILSGYIGRYLKDETFRESVREKCYACLESRKKDSDNGVFANMELGIESIEQLVLGSPGTHMELRMKSLRNSIRLLSIVASLNSETSRNGSTCGIPNSHLSACAQLYLSIVYKLEKNDRISARHLLQVFCDAPFLARTDLLPDLWEHFFLPHLLHLKVWYANELEFLSNPNFGDKEKRAIALSKIYNDQMDMGTRQFAFYYKDWLKVGVKAPPIPSVPLPSRPSYGNSMRRSSDSFSSNLSINKNLYQAVFGPTSERQSMEHSERTGAKIDTWSVEEKEKVCTNEDSDARHHYVHNGLGAQRRSPSQHYRFTKDELWSETQRIDFFRFFTCQRELTECLVNGNFIVRNDSIRKEENSYLPASDLARAITTISSSDSLTDCERAVRVITKAWLDSHGDRVTESALSKAPVIEGILEVLFASNDDEILELGISILAEFVWRKEANRQIILSSDPQLEIFMRLLRSSSLFLKAAVLLYLLKPKAKQLISIEWIPLVLRVLEFGDQLQTLFTVRCSPQVAAYYFLDQLLMGFNEDQNLENARQVVSIGGLSLLVKRIETGDACGRNNAASIISCCIQADGSCRHYLANNLNKASILELLVLGNQKNSSSCAFALLTELICLNRRTQITKFLDGLQNGGAHLNTMHILLVYLQRAPPEERPLVAALLLQLDLLGDPSKSSVYREEAVETIIAALDCQTCNEKVQQQSSKTLMILGGRFSYTGEASAEKWLLQQAGLEEISEDSLHNTEIFVNEIMNSGSLENDEEEATENWQKKAAIALFRSGNKRFLSALSDSIANGIPCLARASLVTVSWMSNFLCSMEDESFRWMACSILVPQLIELLSYNRDVEERVIASYSLLNLAKNSECTSMLSSLDHEELVNSLRNLSLVTWTANELMSIITSRPRHRFPDRETVPSSKSRKESSKI